MNHSAAHTALVKKTLLVLGSRPDVTAWKQAKLIAQNGRTGSVIDVGVKGMFDIAGVLDGGLHFEVECKTGKGRLSGDQKVWAAMLDRRRAIHFVVREDDDACALLDQAIKATTKGRVA